MAATNHPEQSPGGADPQPDRQREESPKVQPGEDTLSETQFMFSETSSRAASGSRQASIDAWLGRRMGRYEIRGLLGVGGMGVVYRGYDELIEREVAIKMLPEEVSENSVNLQRFLSEAKAAGKLNHPNAVAIYEVGQEGNHYYLVMEFVTGGSVADQMERVGALSCLRRHADHGRRLPWAGGGQRRRHGASRYQAGQSSVRSRRQCEDRRLRAGQTVARQ